MLAAANNKFQYGMHLDELARIWKAGCIIRAAFLDDIKKALKDKKTVLVQKDTDAKDLTAGEMIHVIYATPAGQEPVLLSAVVQPADK